MRFCSGPLQIIKHQIILLALGNLRDTTPQEELDAIEPSECLAKWLIKEALHHRKGFYEPEFSLLTKSCHMMLQRITTLIDQVSQRIN